MTNLSPKQKNALLLVARLIVGGIFVATGWMKVSDMPATIHFFQTFGIPAFLTYLVAYAELLGGLALVLGVWTERAATVLAVIMIGAVYFTHAGGLMTYGFPLATLAALLSLLASGAGTYALHPQRRD